MDSKVTVSSETDLPNGAVAGAVQGEGSHTPKKSQLELREYTPESPLRRPWALLSSIVLDIWSSRELVFTLFWRDLKAQYRQAALGYLWLIIPSLATALVWFMMNQQKIVTVDTGDVSYPVFVLIGTTLWTAFSSTLMAPSDEIFKNREVFVKLNVSVEAFILAGLLRSIFNFLAMMFVLVPLLLWLGVEFRFSWLLLPLGVLGLLLCAFTLGLMLAPIGALYQDVKNGLGPLLGVLIFTAPIVFPIPAGNGLLATIVRWNPITPSIVFSRDCLLNGSLEFLPAVLLWIVVTILLVVLAFIALRISKPHIIARMGM